MMMIKDILLLGITVLVLVIGPGLSEHGHYIPHGRPAPAHSIDQQTYPPLPDHKISLDQPDTQHRNGTDASHVQQSRHIINAQLAQSQHAGIVIPGGEFGAVIGLSLIGMVIGSVAAFVTGKAEKHKNDE